MAWYCLLRNSTFYASASRRSISLSREKSSSSESSGGSREEPHHRDVAVRWRQPTMQPPRQEAIHPARSVIKSDDEPYEQFGIQPLVCWWRNTEYGFRSNRPKPGRHALAQLQSRDDFLHEGGEKSFSVLCYSCARLDPSDDVVFAVVVKLHAGKHGGDSPTRCVRLSTLL